MRGIIIYKTRYGASKKFATWLKEETSLEILEFKNKIQSIEKFELIILIGSIHSGKIGLSKWLIKNWEELKKKKVVFLLVSGAEKEEKDFLDQIVYKNIPKEIIEKMKLFYVGGRYKFSEMSFFDRNLIKLVSFFMKNPDAKKGMLKQTDDVKKENILPVAKYVKSLN